MEDRETARMRKYGESKTTRIMMATLPHVFYGLGLRKFQADGFLLTRVYKIYEFYSKQRFSEVEIHGRFEETCCLHIQDIIMTSVHVYQTARRHIP